MNEVDKVDKVDIKMLTEVLKTHIMKVQFTKVDGTKRTLVCTQNMGEIPNEFHPSDDTVHDEDSSTIRVFEVDLQEWRSFRKDSVISWSPVSAC